MSDARNNFPHTDPPDPLFPATRWSLVVRVQAGGEAAAVRALDELLKVYWQPLYVFARRIGLAEEDAKDAVQGFCADLIRLESLQSADQARGKLRSFLLGAFQNHLRTLHRDAQRQKRGGGVQLLSLDDAEAVLGMELMHGETPDKAFDRRWAYTLLDRVLHRLSAEYHERGRGDVFAVLKPLLAWNGAAGSRDELAQKLHMNAVTLAQNVKRLRERYRKLLEKEIADTVDGPEAAAQEREHLIRVLTGA